MLAVWWRCGCCGPWPRYGGSGNDVDVRVSIGVGFGFLGGIGDEGLVAAVADNDAVATATG